MSERMADVNLSSPRRKLTIKLTILISFALVLTLACGSIIYYNYIRSSETLIKRLESEIKHVTLAVSQSCLHILSAGRDLAELNGKLAEHKTIVLDEPTALISLSIRMLEVSPHILAFYNVDKDGNFLAISRVKPDSAYPYDQQRLLPNTALYDVHIIIRAVDSISEYHEFKDAAGHTVAISERPPAMDYYDARTRPWYIEAVKLKKPIWSDPYIFAIFQEEGVAAAYPILDQEGDVRIVTAAYISLAELAQLLERNAIGKTGVFFVFNKKGQLIGYPKMGRVIKNGKAIVPTINDSKNVAAIAAVEQFQKTNVESFRFELHDEIYVARFSDMSSTLNKDWILGFVGLKKEFIADERETIKGMVGFSLIILALSITLIYFISRDIASPIESIVGEMKKVGDLDIEITQPILSRFAEVDQMNQAMASMKRSLRDFARFVPKAMVKRLIESGEGAELGGKKLNVTVMFSDIESFSSISERMTSEKLALHLSDYFDQLTQIILEERGTVDKYIGDSIMAFWGAPVEDNEHPLFACRAAMRCYKRLQGLNKTWELDGTPPLPTRFGIHSGDAVVGNIGSKERLNYSAFGDAVNIASRLEGINKYYHTSIIISYDTFKRVRSDFICRPLDTVIVYGKAKGITIYELLAERTSDSQSRYDQEQAERVATLTTNAYEFYGDREFKKAEKIYHELARVNPDDYVAQLYIIRCQEYQKNPPPSNWRGIYEMHEK
jgi:adenylate cyclase